MIDSKTVDQVYSWPEAGLRLYLPAGPLPQHVDKKFIKLRTISNSSFHFPANVKIMSALYTIQTDINLEVKLEMEHCYRGDQQALAFAYCLNREPPFKFTIASRDSYECSFTSTHGVIKTRHFSHWAIVLVKKHWAIGWIKHLLSPASESEEIIVIPFYQASSRASLIRVNVVILKNLKAHSEVNSCMCHIHNYLNIAPPNLERMSASYASWLSCC